MASRSEWAEAQSFIAEAVQCAAEINSKINDNLRPLTCRFLHPRLCSEPGSRFLRRVHGTVHKKVERD